METLTTNGVMTTQEVASRFNELAQQEKWIQIQDELFANNVKSIDPADSPYFDYAEGIEAVRNKGKEFIKKVTALNRAFTSQPVVCGNHFAVGREVDVETNEFGRVQINQIMLYEVNNGKIISEQFFY